MKQFALEKEVAEQQQDSLRRKVYIKGLPSTCDKAKLHEVFSSFGEVDKAFIMYNHKNGSTRGFGFVEFVAQESALEAVGKVIEICGKEIQVSMAIQRHKGVRSADGRKRPLWRAASSLTPTRAKQPRSPGTQETDSSLLLHYQEACLSRSPKRRSP